MYLFVFDYFRLLIITRLPFGMQEVVLNKLKVDLLTLFLGETVFIREAVHNVQV